MNLNRHFLLGAITGIGGLTLKTILNIIVYPAILSGLGGTQFGLYVLLLGIVELLIALDLGFTSGLTQRLSTTHAKENLTETQQFLSTGLILYLCITVIVLLNLFIVPYLPGFLNIDKNLIQITIFCLYFIILEGALTLFQGYFTAILQANCRYQCVNTSETVYYLISNGGIFILLYLGMGLKEITLLRLTAAIIKFFMIFIYCLKTQPGVLDFSKFSLEKTKDLMQISIHSMVKNVSDILAGRMDLLIISKFLTLKDVGLFAFTYRFLNLAAEFPIRFTAGVYPIFTRLHVLKQVEKSRLLFIRLSSLVYFGINFMVLLLIFYYAELFKFFAKENIDFAASWPIFLLAIPPIITSSLYLPANHFLFASGKHKYISATSSLMALAKVVTTVLFVKLFGLCGVVISTILVRCTFHQFVIIRKTCQYLYISLKEYLVEIHCKMILPVLITSLSLWVLKELCLQNQNLVVQLALSSIISFMLGFVIWFYTTASEFEFEYIRSYIQKIQANVFEKNKSTKTAL